MSYSQKQGPGGNSSGGGGPSNQATQQAAKALAGIQQQMQNLVHGQNALPQSSQAGLNAFLTQQHYEMLKQQQQQMLLSNPQLQQRFQQQMQQSKDRGEPLALTRTPAAAELLNKTYQQHHQQQSNGNNGPAASLASVNQQFQQQMQAANLMQQLHAYQLQFQQQQQQQQQQHHQQPQQPHHQQQSSHQHQQKSHTQASLSAVAMQNTKQQHNQQMQQPQFSQQKYLPTAAHSKSTVSGVGIPPPPPALASQLKPPNLPPSTQITPIPSPQHSTANNNLPTKGSSSSSVKQVPPSISLLPAKQPPVSLPNAPVAAHLHHHHQNKVPLSIPSQYTNPGSKAPLVSAIPPPFPSHYQKMSNQPPQPQLPQNSNTMAAAVATVHEQEPKLQTTAVPLTKQQHQPPQSSAVTISSCSPAKAPAASQTPPKAASLPPLLPLPANESEDASKICSLSAASATARPPPPPLQVPEISKLNTPNSTPTASAKPSDASGSSSAQASPTRPMSEPNSPPNPEAKNGDGDKSEACVVPAGAGLPETTKTQLAAVQVIELPAAIPLTVEKHEDDKNIKEANTTPIDKFEKHPLAPEADTANSIPISADHDTSADQTNPAIEDDSPVSDVSSTDLSKSNDTAVNSSNNTSTSSDEEKQPQQQQEQPDDESKLEPVVETNSKVKEDKVDALSQPTSLAEKPGGENTSNTSEEKSAQKIEKADKCDRSEKPEKYEKHETVEKPTKPEKNEKKQLDKPTEKEKSEKAIKSNQSEKMAVKSKTPRQSKTAAAEAISAEAIAEKPDKQKDSSSKAKTEDMKSPPSAKVDTKRSQSKAKPAVQAHVLSSTPSTPSDRKSKRHRLKTILYQSPLPELAFITKLSASEASNSPKPMSAEDKLIVFYRNEYMAVRNAEGSFFLCQTLQNVYRSSPRISIRWLSEDKKDNTVFIPDFYDHTDIECILTTVELKKLDKGQLRLPKTEKIRIESILKRAIDVEKGILPRPDVTEENPDGLDISLYKDESQIEKKSSLTGLSSGKRSSFTRSSASKRNRSKAKSPSKKKKSISLAKKRKKSHDGSDSNESDEEDNEDEESDSDVGTDKEYKPSKSKRSILSNTQQSTKPQRAQRSPLAKARAASPITPTTSRSRKSVPEKNTTPASSVNSRNDRAAKRRAVENTNASPEVAAKKLATTPIAKSVKVPEKTTNTITSAAVINASETEARIDENPPKTVNKASTLVTSTKKKGTGTTITPPATSTTATTTPTTTPSTPSTSGTRPTRSRK